MTKEELYELMEDDNLGYACVFNREDQGMHTDYMRRNGGALGCIRRFSDVGRI